jgi:hypothetical protein
VTRIARGLCQPLTSTGLGGGGLTLARSLAMQAALGGYAGLKVLVLRNTALHCKGAIALAEALKVNGFLQVSYSLSLSLSLSLSVCV